jgi:hypothetical protein
MGHILRSSQVKLEGRCELGRISTGADGVPSAQAPSAEQVRIAEQQDSYTVLEILCSCGAKLVVRCEHG